MRISIAGFLACLLLCLAPARTFAQEEYNNPELKWLTFESENFIYYYTPGLEDVVALAAKIAEQIHEPLCAMYDYRPDTKVSLIFSDTDDIANASSYFQSNKIRFYATSMNWDFRGTHNWLHNVLTHEYAHMIQLGATRKWSRHFPAAYFQLLGYEKERRPDVLYGYPNRLISWPLPSITIPAWFAEGTAQYQFTGSDYDFWDSHRDMLLRQATLNNRLLSFEEMGYFGKTSLESEGVYNQGYALTRYIADHSQGAKSLRDVGKAMSNPLPVTLNDALKKVTGKSGNQWYGEWKRDLKMRYGAVHEMLKPQLSDPDTLPTTGYVNLFPRISPDGKKIAFISNQNRDYYGQSSLYIFDRDSNKAAVVAPAAHGGLCWLPDGTGVVFSRRSEAPYKGYLQHDLYVYFLKDKETVRITKGMRAESVDVSPDGKYFVCTINEAGRRDIAVGAMPQLPDKKVKPVTRDDLLLRLPSIPHEQYYAPRWRPDGRQIAVGHHLQEGKSIRIFDVTEDRSSLTLAREINDEFGYELRDPSWSDDDNHLLTAWDQSGISNIFRIELSSGNREMLTSVLGGAYYPDMRGDQLVYADFCENGFRVCRLDQPKPLRPIRSTLDENSIYAPKKPEYDLAAAKPDGNSYKPTFESLYWFPRIAFDYNTFKPGTYLLLNDVLDKLSFIGGFAINEKKDYDLYGQVEYRALYPTAFAELYHVQRRLAHTFADSTRIVGEDPGHIPIYDTFDIRYRYQLNEIDFGLRVPLGGNRTVKATGVYSRYVAHNRFDDGTAISITYFKGWAGKLSYSTDQRRRGIVSEINPSAGHKGYIEYTRANHLFFTDIEVGGNAIGLQEIYAPYNYDLVEGGLEKYFSLPGWSHTLELRARGGYIGEKVDPFFYIYAGGLPGMRGYSFYSLGGERNAVATGTYRFPIVTRASWNLWPLSVNRIYGSAYFDVGDAWAGDFDGSRLKKDVGAGLRMQLHSFYSYPTSIAFDVAYGFDKFTLIEDEDRTDYGQELRYYLTVLFDFYSPFAERTGHDHGF